MTLDEAIVRERQLAKEQRSHIGTWDDEYSKKCEVYAEEHEQIANWLEELKTNRIALEKANGYLEVNHRLGYNKAIDEYKNSIKEELDRFEVKNLDTCVLFDLMGRKAEKMKAGEEND